MGFAMQEELSRPRRNLLIITVGLLLFEFADVEIAKIGLLGTELLVGKPRVIEYFAWVLWFYFFWRYLQRLISFVGDGKFGIAQDIRDRMAKLAINYANLKAQSNSLGESLDKFDLVKVGMFAWEVRNSAFDPATGRCDEKYKRTLPMNRVIYWAGISTVSTLILSTKISDYILPIVLGLCPPVVAWLY